MTSTITLDGHSLTLHDVIDVAIHNTSVTLCPKARQDVLASRQVVENILSSDEIVYSINTGFGALSSIVIPLEDVDLLQLNFVRSHAAGTGKPLNEPVTRAMMTLRANTLAKGYSGVRPEVIELLIEMINRGITPVVPSQGSLGASGDLAPLAHLALVLIGEGEAWYQGTKWDGASALKHAGLSPITLKAKEGLALVNGTQMMTAIGILVTWHTEQLCKVADISAAMSVEGFLGSHRPFMDCVQRVRPHPGQMTSATNCRQLLDGSEIAHSHANCKKVQDPYSFRCTPQVHGAVRDTLNHVKQILECEVNAATDNPLIFADSGLAISQGNFHGEPVAMAMDFLGIALAELGNIAERRIDKLNDPNFSELPAFLTQGKQGLNSGTMIAHYTAASLVSENKVLAHPASVDSIPSSNNKEDHVSMGSIAARKAQQISDHVRTILATEVFCALQALRHRHPLVPGKGVQAAVNFLSPHIAPLQADRVLVYDIQQIESWLRDGSLVTTVEQHIGGLQ